MENVAETTKEDGKELYIGGISGSTIKIIAIVTMLIDHIAATLLTRILIVRGLGTAINSNWMQENGTLYYTMVLMRLIGRLGFPLFCFLLVEGFQKTSNVRKYAVRLGLFALISEIPFDLALSGKAIDISYQNVFFTLLLGLLLLWGINKLDEWKPVSWIRKCLVVLGVIAPPCLITYMIYGYMRDIYGVGIEITRSLVIGGLLLVGFIIIAIVRAVREESYSLWRFLCKILLVFLAMAAADFLRTDYGSVGIITILLIYIFRRRKVLAMTYGCIALTLSSLMEITAFFSLIPIAYYNGKRGLKLKYLFYAFYPVHLFLLWLIAELMGIGAVPAI